MSLRQIRRRTAKNFYLLLEKAVSFPQFTQLRRLGPGLASLFTRLDPRVTEPLIERPDVNPEVLRDLRDRDPGLTVQRDPNNIVTELFRIRLRHDDILPGQPHG